MADPILHIKDCYFFEVPKFAWQYHYTDASKFREDYGFFADELYEEAKSLSIDELNYELAGKILIRQPFATLKNLYDKKSGFAISKFMILELFAALIIIAVFTSIARRMSTYDRPRGKFWNLFEALLFFVRDNVAVPAMGKHTAEQYLPLLWTMFFFIFTCNLLGLVPFLGTPTGAWGATFGLACITFFTGLVMGTKQFGPIGYWLNQIPHMDLPTWLKPLKLLIFLLEVLSLFIKHGVLSIRLLANMVAGHLVLLSILGLIVAAAAASTSTWAGVSIACVGGSAALSLLELLVAALQAYVFTLLSALFINGAVHHH
jgi:F-type H+-transporting ATPase subunit a